MAEATWSGLFLMAIKPEGQNLADKQKEYQQVVKNMVRGGPNVLMEHPDDVKFQNVDFAPKVKEFQDLTEAMLRYQVAVAGLPHSMFYDESASNRATLIGKIQLVISVIKYLILNQKQNIIYSTTLFPKHLSFVFHYPT